MRQARLEGRLEQGSGLELAFLQALEFGMKYQGTYMDSELPGLKDHGKHYPSSNYEDELAWGNLWVYFATGVSAGPAWILWATRTCLRSFCRYLAQHLQFRELAMSCCTTLEGPICLSLFDRLLGGGRRRTSSRLRSSSMTGWSLGAVTTMPMTGTTRRQPCTCCSPRSSRQR